MCCFSVFLRKVHAIFREMAFKNIVKINILLYFCKTMHMRIKKNVKMENSDPVDLLSLKDKPKREYLKTIRILLRNVPPSTEMVLLL